MAIESEKTNILILTIPRTGRNFVEHFLFESTGRVISVSVEDWLAGNNSISYKPKHCLIVEHFQDKNIPLIRDVIQADRNIRIVVPMRDLLPAFVSAALMGHRGFAPSVKTFMDTIDLIDFHPFPIDTPGDKAVKLNNLLQYCGIDSHNNFNKYEEWPNIRSIRPSDDVKEENNEQAVRLREKYDRIMLAIANKEFEELEAEFPTRYSQFKNNRVELQAILESLFGYEGLQWI